MRHVRYIVGLSGLVLLTALFGCAEQTAEDEDVSGAVESAADLDGPGAKSVARSIPNPDPYPGCRGAANRACSELVNAHYFTTHPSCERNTLSCEGLYYDCDNSFCGWPGEGETPDTAWMGKTFAKGETIYSADGTHKLVWQSDGNLVFYRASDNHAVWNSGTYGKGVDLVFQTDGNLVIYGWVYTSTWNMILGRRSYRAVWSSGTQATGDNAYLLVAGGTRPQVSIRFKMGGGDIVPLPLWVSN